MLVEPWMIYTTEQLDTRNSGQFEHHYRLHENPEHGSCVLRYEQHRGFIVWSVDYVQEEDTLYRFHDLPDCGVSHVEDFVADVQREVSSSYGDVRVPLTPAQEAELDRLAFELVQPATCNSGEPSVGGDEAGRQALAALHDGVGRQSAVGAASEQEVMFDVQELEHVDGLAM